MSHLVWTFPAQFELGLLCTFCLCLSVKENPVSEIDLSDSKPTVVVELGLAFVVLSFELCNESFFFEVVEVG